MSHPPRYCNRGILQNQPYQTPITSACPPIAITLSTPIRTLLSHAPSAADPSAEGSTGVPRSSSSRKYVSSKGHGLIEGLRSRRITGTPNVVRRVPITRWTVRLCDGLGGADGSSSMFASGVDGSCDVSIGGKESRTRARRSWGRLSTTGNLVSSPWESI